MKNKAYTIVCLLAIAGAAVWIATGWLSLRNRKQNTAAETSPDASAPAAAGDTTPLATLRFDTRTIDFGNVPSDTLLATRFVLRNTGDYPLVVYYVNPDCSCTGYTLSKPVARPGDTLSIALRLSTRHKIGRQKLYTVVRANTAEQMYRLLLKADVAPQ